MSEPTLYDRLSAQFAKPLQRTGPTGGPMLDYLSGEQVISHLNDVLGVDGWEFRVLQHGHNQEADEIWVLGELTAHFPERSVVRQQFGSQEVKHKRDGDILEIGFDLKGAATDALKKCASLIGVGLWLYAKGGGTTSAPPPSRPAAPQTRAAQPSSDDPMSDEQRTWFARKFAEARALDLTIHPDWEIDAHTKRGEAKAKGDALSAAIEAEKAKRRQAEAPR